MINPAYPEEQRDLFPNLPRAFDHQPAALETKLFDPMDYPGQPQFPGWDPRGETAFHGPASE